MARLIGVDYGLERAGLAVSDPCGKLAFPLMTLYFKDYKNRHEFLDALADIIKKEKAEEVIFGLPLSLDGSENPMCAQMRNTAKRLGRRISAPIHFMPEALSSFEAEEALRAVGLKGEKLKKALDQQAACGILESWIRAGGA